MKKKNNKIPIKLKDDILKINEKIILAEKAILRENRWDTWHVGGVREHLSLSTKDAG